MYFINKREDTKERLSNALLIFVAILFAVFITVVFACLFFIIVGSANVMNSMFSLNMSTEQLIVMSISFFVYWITIDNIFETLFEHLFGKSVYALLSLMLSRVASFYLIGIFIPLNEVVNLTFSIGVALIISTIDGLYFFRKEKKKEIDL